MHRFLPLILLTLTLATPLHAELLWSMQPSTCQPDDSARDKVLLNPGGVMLKPGVISLLTDPVVIRCPLATPLPPELPTGEILWLVGIGRDPDGPGRDTQFRIELWSRTELGTQYRVFVIHSSGPGGAVTHKAFDVIDANVPRDRTYWVVIQLIRKRVGITSPSVATVAIERPPQ